MRGVYLVITVLLLFGCERSARVMRMAPAEHAESLFQQALLPADSWYPRDMERAIGLLDSAILLAPAHFDAHYLKAVLLDELARTDAASIAFHATAALRPYDPVLLRTVGCHYLSIGDSMAAQNWFVQAEGLFTMDEAPTDSLPWQQLVDHGTILMLLGRGDEGIALLDIAFATAVDRAGRDLVDHLRALPPRILAHALLPERAEVVRGYRER